MATKSLFVEIEASPNVVQHGWDDKSSSSEGYRSIIEEANKSINLIDYLQTKLDLEFVNSSNGWSYKAPCPFHKHGQERTASFFVNIDQNRFYCQACGASGGISEYISKTYKRSIILTAEHILQCAKGNFKIDDENIKKANERKRFQESLLKLSDLYRTFVQTHLEDDAINYANKCFCAFDSLLEQKPEDVMKSMDMIITKFETYFKKY